MQIWYKLRNLRQNLLKIMALLSLLSSSNFVRRRESWLPAQTSQLRFNLLTECMWNSFVGHVTVWARFLAKTYLLVVQGAAEAPVATSTRQRPSSVDWLLAFFVYCWKWPTTGRWHLAFLHLRLLLLLRPRLPLGPYSIVYCVLSSVAFVACLHKHWVPRRPHWLASVSVIVRGFYYLF